MLSSSAAMGMGGYHQQPPQQRGAAPVFTAAQWAELEQQALIYKYLMAGVPVPSELLLPIRPHSAAATSFNFANPAASPFYHHHHPHPSMSYYAYYGKKLDPEPWRCRRTDGKKWRCAKEAHPDSKYCERHMHRGLWNPSLLPLRTRRRPSCRRSHLQPATPSPSSPWEWGRMPMACLLAGLSPRRCMSITRHMAANTLSELKLMWVN